MMIHFYYQNNACHYQLGCVVVSSNWSSLCLFCWVFLLTVGLWSFWGVTWARGWSKTKVLSFCFAISFSNLILCLQSLNLLSHMWVNSCFLDRKFTSLLWLHVLFLKKWLGKMYADSGVLLCIKFYLQRMKDKKSYISMIDSWANCLDLAW